MDGGAITRIVRDDDLRACLGVPYVAPPVGDLHLRRPAPVVPWEGVRRRRLHREACDLFEGIGED